MWVPSLGRGDPLEEGMTSHSSILAWRIPWTEEPGGLQSMGSHRVRHNWSNDLSRSMHAWRPSRPSLLSILAKKKIMWNCQEAFNRRLPVCCFGSVRNPLFLINSWIFRNWETSLSRGWGIQAYPLLVFQHGDKYPLPSYEPYCKSDCLQLSLFNMNHLCFVSLEF